MSQHIELTATSQPGSLLRVSRPKHWERYGLNSWIEAAKKRLHHNVLAIALANKLARIAWSVLAHGRAFEANNIQAAAGNEPPVASEN
jgi:hypothetical protein